MIKNLLALAGLLAVVFAVVGWYRGWYQVSSAPGSGGHTKVTIDLDGQKIKEDVQSGKEKLREILNRDEGKQQNVTQQPQQAQPTPPVQQVQNQKPVAPPKTQPTNYQTDDGWFVLPGDLPELTPQDKPQAPPRSPVGFPGR